MIYFEFNLGNGQEIALLKICVLIKIGNENNVLIY